MDELSKLSDSKLTDAQLLEHPTYKKVIDLIALRDRYNQEFEAAAEGDIGRTR